MANILKNEKQSISQNIKSKVKELNDLIKQANENNLLVSVDITNSIEGYNMAIRIEVFEKITY